MDRREASAALEPRAMVRAIPALYADVWRFVRRPTLAVEPLVFGPIFIVAFFALFVLDSALSTSTLWLEWGITSTTGYEFPKLIEDDLNLVDDFVTVVILAPIVEEALFRGWLRGESAALRFALFGWGAVVLATIASFIENEIGTLLSIAALALAIFGIVRWVNTRSYDTAVPDWFAANFRWFVWGSALTFGAVHLLNFEDVTTPLDFVAVASQTVGGLVLAYTRLHLGLNAAIVQHAAFNFMILVLVELFPGV